MREYFIPDFSNWSDDDKYNEALQRLIKVLKSDIPIDKKGGPKA